MHEADGQGEDGSSAAQRALQLEQAVDDKVAAHAHAARKVEHARERVVAELGGAVVGAVARARDLALLALPPVCEQDEQPSSDGDGLSEEEDVASLPVDKRVQNAPAKEYRRAARGLSLGDDSRDAVDLKRRRDGRHRARERRGHEIGAVFDKLVHRAHLDCVVADHAPCVLGERDRDEHPREGRQLAVYRLDVDILSQRGGQLDRERRRARRDLARHVPPRRRRHRQICVEARARWRRRVQHVLHAGITRAPSWTYAMEVQHTSCSFCRACDSWSMRCAQPEIHAGRVAREQDHVRRVACDGGVLRVWDERERVRAARVLRQRRVVVVDERSTMHAWWARSRARARAPPMAPHLSP